MAFRTPTLLNSIDLQYGQRVENSPTVAWIMALNLGFRRAVCGGAGADSEGGWSKVRGGRFAGWSERGWPRALPLNCSGVLRSGSDSLTRSLARETWRLCRFSNLLFMLVLAAPRRSVYFSAPQSLADRGLGGEHERGDGSGILQSRAGYFGGIDHAGFHQVFVLLGGGVEAEVRIVVGLDLLDHDGAFGPAVQHDLPHRLLASAAHDGHAELLVALELQLLQRDRSAQQRNATARHDAFLDGCASGMQGVFDAGLFLFHLGFGGGTDFDDRHAAGQLRQALLQFLAVVVRGSLFDLGAELLDPALDVLRAYRRRR